MHYFLILYLWHGAGVNNSSAGGPSLTVTSAPSLAVCEQLGAAAKKLADELSGAARVPGSRSCGGVFGNSDGWCGTRPAEYRCVALQ